MTESRYKIEYAQAEQKEEGTFQILGVFGYLWLALLASVLTYGLVYKNFSTNDVVSYIQHIKTGIVNTDITHLTDTSDTIGNRENIESNQITQTINTKTKLVSEVIDHNESPENLVFESEAVDTIKEKITTKPQSTNTIESATAAIESQKVNNEVTPLLEPLKDQHSKLPTSNQPLEESTQAEAITTETVLVETKEQEVIKEITEQQAMTVTSNSTGDTILKDKTSTNETLTPKVIAPLAALSALASDPISGATENDLAYVKAVEEYKKNMQVSKIVQDQHSSQENKKTQIKKAEKPKLSAIDAIIATMNAEKAAKEKPPLSTQEKVQSEINHLIEKQNSDINTSQLNQ